MSTATGGARGAVATRPRKFRRSTPPLIHPLGGFENSKRLDRLEAKLSGFIRTETGRISNKLVRSFPGYVFVIEDLDLRGCKGQKRFAYKALQSSLEKKAPVIKVNPAYTSQACPACGHVSRRNRSGIRFRCTSCGNKLHADSVGSVNLLGRSEDHKIKITTSVSEVKTLLSQRYFSRRNPKNRTVSQVGSLGCELASLSSMPRLRPGKALNAEGFYGQP